MKWLRADFRQNCAFSDTSIGMSSLQGSLDKKIVVATWNFKMVAIFQDGDIGMKIGTTSLHEALNKKMLLTTWNFKLAAIFQDGRHLGQTIRLMM